MEGAPIGMWGDALLVIGPGEAGISSTEQRLWTWDPRTGEVDEDLGVLETGRARWRAPGFSSPGMAGSCTA